MNYDLNKYKFSTLDLVYDEIQEIPVDSDLVLPDYCLDIGKILKCQVTVEILSRNISGDSLTFDGNSILELFYSDLEKNTIRCFKTDIPFSKKVNIKKACDFCVSTFKIKRDYVNCRAISPRRIDVHGAVSLNIKVFGLKNIEITNDILSDEIKQQKLDVPFSQLSSILQHQINLNETLNLESENSTPELIVKSNISVDDINCEVSNEKINLKSKINLKIIYINDIETGKLDSIEYEIPINEVVDAPGIMDDNLIITIPEIIFHDEKISFDESEDLSNLIAENAKIIVTIFSFQKDETKIIKDAYSTEYETELSYDLINFRNFSKSFNEYITHKETIDYKENNFFKILDIWHTSISSNFVEKDSNIEIEGKIHLCILAIDPDFVPFYFEQEINFSKKIDDNFDLSKIYYNIFPNISKIEHKILNNNSIEIKINLCFKVNIFDNNKQKIVSNIVSDENNRKPRDQNTALTIYYASAGENIWDIAKHYGTTLEQIQNENEIDFEVLESDRAILIPIV